MTTTPRLAKRVLLVGLEGVDWSALQTSMQTEGLPTLAALLRSGVSGPLIAPAPRIEASSWTSLITGVRAHKHQVLHASQPADSDRGTCSVARPTIQTANLGAILSESRLTVHQVGWPVSHPAERLRGIVVSDLFARPGRSHSIRDSGGWPWVTPTDAAKELFARRCSPNDVDDITVASILPTDLLTQPTLGHVQRVLRIVLAESLTLFRSAKWCMQNTDWDCTLCSFPMALRLRETLGQQLSPAEQTRFTGGMLAGCYEYLDMLLSQLIACAGEEATIVVVGMGPAVAPQPRLVMQSPIFSSGILPVGASVLDVAPTLLTLLGIPSARDMDGQVWNELLPSDHVPLEPIETWNTCIHRPGEPGQPLAESPELPTDESVRHLLELGYVDPLETAAREQADRCRRETQRNRALSLLEAGQFDEAIRVLNALKTRYPNWPSSYELLAETYLQQGQYDLAEQELEFLVHHGAESARLYLALGRIAAAKREPSHALQHFHVAERIAANLPGLQLARGFALLRQREFEDAKEAFQHALSTDRRGPSALDGLATCHLGLGQHAAAAEFALEAIEQNVQFAPAHYHLALALVGLGRNQDAKQAFETGASIDPQFVAPLRWLARLCAEYLSEPDQAEAYRHRAREIIRGRRRPV